jgi:hypothetical protein
MYVILSFVVILHEGALKFIKRVTIAFNANAVGKSLIVSLPWTEREASVSEVWGIAVDTRLMQIFSTYDPYAFVYFLFFFVLFNES